MENSLENLDISKPENMFDSYWFILLSLSSMLKASISKEDFAPYWYYLLIAFPMELDVVHRTGQIHIGHENLFN